MLKKNIFYNLNKKHIFFISLVVCSLFYYFENLIGIDKFYHPDSIHYLDPLNFPLLTIVPKSLFEYLSWGFYFFVKILNYNYELIIIINFLLYSLTNVYIFEKIFKNYLKEYNFIELNMLIYLLFLDPYRLHLACHVLKETLIIFFFSIIILSKFNYIKIIFIILLEFFRKNSFIYLLIFFKFKSIISLFYFPNKIINKKYFKFFYIILFSLILLAIYFFVDLSYLMKRVDWLLQHLHYREFPSRAYDNIPTFKEGRYQVGGPYLGMDHMPFNPYFYEGLFLKLFSWTIILFTGAFAFFTNSFMFKILGFLVLLNHILIFKLTKKTYISIGLIMLIFSIAIYSGSYTAFYRYCYLGLFFSILNFFFTQKTNEK